MFRNNEILKQTVETMCLRVWKPGGWNPVFMRNERLKQSWKQLFRINDKQELKSSVQDE